MAEVSRRWQKSWAFLFGLFGPGISAWAVYAIVELWPRLHDQSTSPSDVALGLGITWRLGLDQSFLVLAILGGLLGGLLYTMGIYASRRSSGRSRAQDANWYWVRCVVGGGLGLAVYVLLRSGLFLLGADASAGTTSGGPTAYTVLAVSMVVGLFTDKVLTKLRQVAGNFFATKEDAAHEQGLHRPTIQGWSPSHLVRGVDQQQLTLDVVGGAEPPRSVRLAGVQVAVLEPGADGKVVVPVDVRFVTAVDSLTVAVDAGDGAASVVTVPVGPVEPAAARPTGTSASR
jgi:hypothetical protein